MTLNKIQIIIIAILIPAGLLFWYLDKENATVDDLLRPGVPVMHIDDIPIRVEIADSMMERTTGLSGREKLESVNGLLFVFPEADFHAIWMKDMRFPIDIIWISEDLRVVDIDRNVSPDTYPELFRPQEPAMYVLETNARYVDTFGIQVGDNVRLPGELVEK